MTSVSTTLCKVFCGGEVGQDIKIHRVLVLGPLFDGEKLHSVK